MIAQMIRCPTCSGLAESKSRFCSSCYTVFPSGNGVGNRRFEAATTNRSVTWRGPSYFFAVALVGAWFATIDTNDSTAEPGSYQAIARDMKRSVLAWVDKSTKEWQSKPAGADGAGWSLDNSDLIPCDPGSFCDVVIHFDEGQSAAFVIERSNSGGASITARGSRGTGLLRSASRGQLVFAPPRRVAQTLSIVRKSNDRWSIVNEAQLTPTGARAGHPDSEEGP